MTRACQRRLRLRSGIDPPLFALLTDFGLRDGFVGQVKAVILGIVPRVQIVDLSHDVPAQDIHAGALILETAYQTFPWGTIFLCVVDPGVGSERLPIVLQTPSGLFIAPDNGLLTPILTAYPKAEARVIQHPLLYRESLSATFHGRDVFAVAAARLGAGFPFKRAGALLPEPARLQLTSPTLSGKTLRGEVIAADNFGNAASNIRLEDLQALGGEFAVFCGGVSFGPLRDYYAQAPSGIPLAILNSAGRLELAVNCGRAVDLGAEVGAVVEVHRTG